MADRKPDLREPDHGHQRTEQQGREERKRWREYRGHSIDPGLGRL